MNESNIILRNYSGDNKLYIPHTSIEIIVSNPIKSEAIQNTPKSYEELKQKLHETIIKLNTLEQKGKTTSKLYERLFEEHLDIAEELETMEIPRD